MCLIRALCAVMLLVLCSCSSAEVAIDDGDLPAPLSYEIISENAQGLIDPSEEVRGVWIATVGNINFPSRKGLSSTALKSELRDIVKKCKELGLNTIFFQVRPAADALYRSELFPVSEYLSGEQGKSPDGNFDCLAYLVELCYKEKISVHAWVNPLRVTYGSAKYPRTDLSALSAGHIARKNPEWVIPYADGKLYFDAGEPAVREYIVAGVREIVKNYAVDGVVFDDYFYPYPVSGAEFDDSRSFALYGSGERDDWRRENINSLVKSCYEAVKSEREQCAFGISPFGIWQNDDGENGGSKTRGLEAYSAIYCDALSWIEGGYLDYISPQLYWRFETAAAPYGELLDWWNAALEGSDVKLIVSHGAYMYDEWSEPSGELSSQIEYSRNAEKYRGSVLYGYDALKRNSSGICDELSDVFGDKIIYYEPIVDK